MVPPRGRHPTLPDRLAVAGILAFVGLAGCTVPDPSPIDPVETEADYRARSLDDPELLAYLESSAIRRSPGDPWELEALTRVALYFHPDMDVARARIAEAEAAEVTAGARPNPTLGAGFDYNFDIPVGSPWTYAFDLSVPVELGGKRSRRMEAAESRTEVARLELAETAWRVYSRVRDRLVGSLLAAEDALAAGEAVEAYEKWQGLVEKQLRVGAASRPDLDATRTEASEARLAWIVARGESSRRFAHLADALGLPLNGLPERLDTGVLERPPDPSGLSLQGVQEAGILNRVDVRRSLAEYAAAEAELRVEVSKQFPDLQLGPGYLYEEGERKFVLGISATLPIFHQNDGPIAEALARRHAAGAAFLSLQARAIGEIESTLEAYRAAWTAYRESARILTEYAALTDSLRRAVELGREDPLELLKARIRVLSARRVRVDFLRRLHESLGALEDALQRPWSWAEPTDSHVEESE